MSHCHPDHWPCRFRYENIFHNPGWLDFVTAELKFLDRQVGPEELSLIGEAVDFREWHLRRVGALLQRDGDEHFPMPIAVQICDMNQLIHFIYMLDSFG